MRILRLIDATATPFLVLRTDTGDARLGGTVAELLSLPLVALRSRLDEAAARAADETTGATIVAPVDGRTEVWAAGVTYQRSRVARMAESEQSADIYDRVYDAVRPELFFKASAWRAVGPGRTDLRTRRLGHQRARARAGRRRQPARRGRRLRRLQRRELTFDRGREPAVPAAGQGLSRQLRPRPVDHPRLGGARPVRSRHRADIIRDGDDGVERRRRTPASCTAGSTTCSSTCSAPTSSRTAWCCRPAPASCPSCRSPSPGGDVVRIAVAGSGRARQSRSSRQTHPGGAAMTDELDGRQRVDVTCQPPRPPLSRRGHGQRAPIVPRCCCHGRRARGARRRDRRRRRPGDVAGGDPAARRADPYVLPAALLRRGDRRRARYLEADIDHAGDTPMGPRPDLRRMLVPLGPGRGLRREQLPAGLLGARRRHRVGAGRRLPGRRQGAPGAPGDLTLCFEISGRGRRGARRACCGWSTASRPGATWSTHPAIRAVGFTGSVAGGRALADLARGPARADPVLRRAGQRQRRRRHPCGGRERAATRSAPALGGSFTLGGGQFCTKPGPGLRARRDRRRRAA